MAIGDIGAIGISTVGIGTVSPAGDGFASLTTATTTFSVSDMDNGPLNSAVQLNTMVQSLNNLAASSSLFQPAMGQLSQLNDMVASIDFNQPLSQQPLADSIAALLIALLNQLNQHGNDASISAGGGGGGTSPLVGMVMAQVALQPMGNFVNTTA